jgi:hypothetical protein
MSQIAHSYFHGKSPIESNAFLILVRVSRIKLYDSRPAQENLSQQRELPDSSRADFNRHRAPISEAFYASLSAETSHKLNDTLLKLVIWAECSLTGAIARFECIQDLPFGILRKR